MWRIFAAFHSDAINGLIYFAEGNIYLGVEYTLRGLPFWGMVAIGCGAPLLGVALIIIGIGFNLAFGVEYLVDAVGTAYEDYQNGEFGLDNAAQLTLGVLSVVGGSYTATRSLRTAARGIAPSNTLNNGPGVNGKSGRETELFLPDEYYQKLDDNIAKAIAARDAEVARIQGLSMSQQRKVTTVVAGVDLRTGKVVVAAKKSEDYGRLAVCAEDIVYRELGGNVNANIIMTPAIRPRSNDVIPVCGRCQTKYPVNQFVKGTTFSDE